MPEHEHPVPAEVAEMLMKAEVVARQAHISAVKARTGAVSLATIVGFTMLPAALIFVYAALWRWLAG